MYKGNLELYSESQNLWRCFLPLILCVCEEGIVSTEPETSACGQQPRGAATAGTAANPAAQVSARPRAPGGKEAVPECPPSVFDHQGTFQKHNNTIGHVAPVYRYKGIHKVTETCYERAGIKKCINPI